MDEFVYFPDQDSMSIVPCGTSGSLMNHPDSSPSIRQEFTTHPEKRIELVSHSY